MAMPSVPVRHKPTISVIIPTSCDPRRSRTLQRAIDSVLTQTNVCVEVIVVVNSDCPDPQILAELSLRSEVRVDRLPTRNLPLARLRGRRLATGVFFGFLDDDDEYLPAALAIRVAPMLENKDTDVVVTSGFCGDADVTLGPVEIEHARLDPILALLDRNWLASCGALFRSATVPASVFEELPPYLEWTILAFRLAREGKRIVFLQDRTYRINNTPGSLSRSVGFQQGELEALKHLLSITGETRTQRQLRRKLGACHHGLAEYCAMTGLLVQSWKHHIFSLLMPGGIKYLLFSRKLLRPWSRERREVD